MSIDMNEQAFLAGHCCCFKTNAGPDRWRPEQQPLPLRGDVWRLLRPAIRSRVHQRCSLLWCMRTAASASRGFCNASVAHATSHTVFPGEISFIEWRYHMHGDAVGSLSVLNSARKVVWSKQGNQGDAWHLGRVEINPRSNSFR